ncbi:MAG: cyclase family protein [Planctomycetota bacterium]|jgi:arylformamidase
MTSIYDITPAVNSALCVWPGDTPPAREVLCDMKQGDNLTLSTLRATVHLGAHVDAPSHYGADAPSIESCAIDLYIGKCQVISVNVARGVRVSMTDISCPVEAPRVLIRTSSYPDPSKFNEDFAALDPELVDAMAARGVRLIGIDTPSVDLFSSQDLPSHQAFLRNDMAILEGIVLADVEDGVYELVALPLKLEGFDASPVRAILRSR